MFTKTGIKKLNLIKNIYYLRNSLDICTEENIYDEPHRLAISDRSTGGHVALENQVSFTLD